MRFGEVRILCEQLLIERHGCRHVARDRERRGQLLLQRPAVWRQRQALTKRLHGERRLAACQRPVAAGFVHDRTAQDLGELAHQRIRQRRLRVAPCAEAGLGLVEASDLAVRHGQRVVDGRGPRLGGQGGFEPRRGQLVIAADERRTTQPEERRRTDRAAA